MIFIRVALVVLGVAACAWFGLGALQARDTDQATAILTSHQHLSNAQATRVSDLLDSAGTLNPDSTLDLLRARAANAQGHGAVALRIARQVTVREPDNLDAWLAVAQLALTNDRSELGPAVARLAKLDPRLN